MSNEQDQVLKMIHNEANTNWLKNHTFDEITKEMDKWQENWNNACVTISNRFYKEGLKKSATQAMKWFNH